jgi:hypothetical protein
MTVSRTIHIGDNRKWVADLILKPGRVALHLLAEEDRARVANRLVELPVDGALGGEDPNWRLLRALQDAAQAELDRRCAALTWT